MYYKMFSVIMEVLQDVFSNNKDTVIQNVFSNWKGITNAFCNN